MGDHWETPHTWTRENLLRNIEGSLRRMKTDYVDLLQLHNPTVEQVRQGDLVEVLRHIRRQGMTKFIGISSTLPHLPEFLAMGVFDTFQVPYSCLEPQHHDALAQAAAAGAGVIVRGGIARGGPDSDVSVPARVDVWQKAGLQQILDGMTPAELILRHTLSHAACCTTIVGTMNVEHLKANVAAAEKGPLPAGLYEEVRRRVAAVLAEEGKKA